MERPLTSGGQKPRQFHRLPYSPSTPNFTSTTPPPKRAWNKIKSIFHKREETTSPQPLQFSSPYSFQNFPAAAMEQDLDFGFAATEHAQEEREDSIFSLAARELYVTRESITLSPTSMTSTTTNLTPAELVARERGLDIDFSSTHALQMQSPASDAIVREYTLIGLEYHAARADRPIFDGKAVNKGKAAVTSPTTSPTPPITTSTSAEARKIGSWRCCKCSTTNPLTVHVSDPTLTSVFHCTCPHRSCDECTLSGAIKPYKPLSEPILIPLSSSREVLFGIVCGSCGVAWRAQEVRQSVMSKVVGMSRMDLLAGVAMAGMSSLNLRADMTKDYGKQVGSKMVGFTGGKCACGEGLHGGCLMVQIDEIAAGKNDEEEAAVDAGAGTAGDFGVMEGKEKEKSFGATEEDKKKGIGKETLTLEVKGKRVRHANPLMSNPV